MAIDFSGELCYNSCKLKQGGDTIAESNFEVYRKRAGLRQCDVAEILGISQVSVWQWENGKALPRADKLPAVAKLYGCTIDDLIGKEGQTSAAGGCM